MACLLAGIACFALIFLSDWLRARSAGRGFPTGPSRLVPACLSLSALACLGLALYLGFSRGPRLALHPIARISAGILALPFLCLLAIAEFGEVRFIAPSRGAPGLVQSGSYALCRHPGFWWLFLSLAPLAIAADSLALAAALPAWAAADFLLVLAEDRVFFPRIFGQAYLDYRSRVPFLVPARGSLRRRPASPRGGGPGG